MGAGLLVGVVCLLVGAALAAFDPLAEGARSLAASEIPSALAAGDPAAWLSAGCLLLIATPCLRLLGMLVCFHAERDRRGLIAAALVLALLAVGLVGALRAEPPPPPPSGADDK